MADRMNGKRALIVGSGGIGGASAQRLYQEGASVALVDNSQETLDRATDLVKNCGGHGQIHGRLADMGDPVSNLTAVDDAAKKLGGLDVVVHAAAAREPTATTEELSIADWELCLKVNLSSVFFLCKHVIPHLRAAGGGVIITIASQFGSVATAGRPAYHATKGAVIQLSRAVAIETVKDNIRAVTVSPGAVETDRLLARHKNIEVVRERLVPGHPIGRLAQPEEIANAVLFVASDEASFMTGSDLIIDGGYTAI